MAKICKYYKQQKYVSYDSGVTWSPLQEFQRGAFIESNSVDCGGGTTMYRWLPSGTTCVGVDKWQLSVYQESTDNGQTWQNVSGVSPSATTLIEANSTDCGYIPPTPIYQWVDMNSGTTWWCDGYDKYVKQKKQQSYDGGLTWEDVTPPEYRKGSTLIETNSEDCGYVPPTPEAQYRWVNSGYTCVGYDKYQQQIKQVSYDSGSTWSNVVPNEFSATTLVESNSSYCGYVPPTPTGYKLYATYTGGRTYSAACDSTSAVTSSDTKVQTTGYEVTDMTSASISECVTSIGGSAFRNCISLTSITIPNTVTEIGGGALEFCSGLTSVVLPTNLSVIHSSLLSNCWSLTSITIPNSVSGIGGGAFSSCSGLTSIAIPSNVTFIDTATFSYCSSLTSITIPSNVTSIGGNVDGGWGSWHTIIDNCPNIASITVDGGNSVYDSRNGCNAIIKTSENKLLEGCKNTTIPSTVTSIGAYAFGGCTSLTSINIPSSVTSIGDSAFYRCSGLTSVTVNATTPPSLGGTSVFDQTNNCPIYVPAASVNAYKRATNWSEYSSRIQGI